MRLRSLVEKGSTEDDLETEVEIMMEEVMLGLDIILQVSLFCQCLNRLVNT